MTKPYVRLTRSNLNPLGTCYQAVRILDTFAEQAIKTGNSELAFAVVEKFVDLATRLSEPDEEVYDEENAGDLAEAPFKIGFGVHK
jgi:hypothetical protein